MKDLTILKKLIKKAVKNEWQIPVDKKYIHQLADEALNYEYPVLSVLDIVFSHYFAKTLNYRLEDLGKWCDKGKKPLKYLEKFLEK